MSAPPVSIEQIDAGTRVVLEYGHRLFQTHRFGASDVEQIEILLAAMSAPLGAVVLDAGCGVGEASRLMAEARPDLSFVLVNLSEYQLSHCPAGERFHRMLGDCHAMPIADGSVGVVMYSSSLCQMDTAIALREAARVLAPGGVLLINDMIRDGGDQGLMERSIGARVLELKDLLSFVRAAGFRIDFVIEPAFDDNEFKAMIAIAGHGGMADHVRPVIIRATI